MNLVKATECATTVWWIFQCQPTGWLQSHNIFWMNPNLAFLLAMQIIDLFFPDESYEIIRLQWVVEEITVIQEIKEHFFLSTQRWGRLTASNPLFKSTQTPINS